MAAYVATAVGAALIALLLQRFAAGRLRIAAGPAWAYFGLILGLSLSFAANIASAFIDQPDDAQPGVVELALAGAAPVVVFVMIEVLARNPSVAPWLRWLSATLVVVPAAAISYVHLVHLAVDGHESGPNAWLYWALALLTPFMVDGLLAACTGALLQGSRVEIEAPLLAALESVPARFDALAAELDAFAERNLATAQERIDALGAALSARLTAQIEQVRAEWSDSGNEGRRVGGSGGDRKRYPLGQHPKYADWAAARGTMKPWGVEDMQAALGPDTSVAAAKSMLQRWENHYVEVQSKGESGAARRDDEPEAPPGPRAVA